ncbi:hypothetical protein BDZ45DRAFT_792884 [Acephala macrosclerotiorum]|nr:hypothetical protein BDZ45DRAFT_792884 [Acephala macrosclerotiorum]
MPPLVERFPCSGLRSPQLRGIEGKFEKDGVLVYTAEYWKREPNEYRMLYPTRVSELKRNYPALVRKWEDKHSLAWKDKYSIPPKSKSPSEANVFSTPHLKKAKQDEPKKLKKSPADATALKRRESNANPFVDMSKASMKATNDLYNLPFDDDEEDVETHNGDEDEQNREDLQGQNTEGDEIDVDESPRLARRRALPSSTYGIPAPAMAPLTSPASVSPTQATLKRPRSSISIAMRSSSISTHTTAKSLVAPDTATNPATAQKTNNSQPQESNSKEYNAPKKQDNSEPDDSAIADEPEIGDSQEESLGTPQKFPIPTDIDEEEAPERQTDDAQAPRTAPEVLLKSSPSVPDNDGEEELCERQIDNAEADDAQIDDDTSIPNAVVLES